MALNFKPHGLINSPVLERLYQKAHIKEYVRAVKDPREHQTVELLENIYNKVLFRDNDNVFVNSQVPPSPDSDDACDIGLKYVEQGTFDTMIFNFTECKRTKAKSPYSLRLVEDQALRYCKQFLSYYTELPFVYASTAIGAHLRLWKVERNVDRLWGMWGNPPREADWSQYYDVGLDSHASEIRRSYDLMLRIGPEPSASQSLETYAGINFPQEPSAMYEISNTVLGSTYDGQGYRAGSSSGGQAAISSDIHPSPVPFGGNLNTTMSEGGHEKYDHMEFENHDIGHPSTKLYTVKVTRNRRTLHKDQFVFKDRKGKTRTTEADE